MLRFNYFILALIVLTITTTTAEKKDSCNVIDETTKPLCNVVKSFYTQDNGQFSTVVCGCMTSFLKSDPSHCKAKNYDFAVAPLCGKLYKSKEFEIAGNKSDNFVTKFTKFLFGNRLNVCTGKNEKKLFQSVSKIFQPGIMSDFYIFVFKKAFSAEVSKLFLHCYKELLDLSPKHSEN